MIYYAKRKVMKNVTIKENALFIRRTSDSSRKAFDRDKLNREQCAEMQYNGDKV